MNRVLWREITEHTIMIDFRYHVNLGFLDSLGSWKCNKNVIVSPGTSVLSQVSGNQVGEFYIIHHKLTRSSQMR